MSQATNYSVPTAAEDATIEKVAYGVRLSESFAALVSAHSGAARPAYAVQGTIWHDTDLLATTPLLFHDGTNDRIIPVEDANGNIAVSGDHISTAATTVAALPTSPAPPTGARAFVTDANATTFASVVAAGGANGVPVYFDGTNWRIG